ncbi:unnamed protein product, partial [Mesorhabditis belari]|uniref:BHLH domain-containing protein n=1 Tax=Mesorhabditis belari TaxID=2138241 RepID=A0AAF3EX36_9BILA
MNIFTYPPQYSHLPSTSISPSPPDISSENMDRKTKKPLMEKRRRERINASLSTLKEILMAAYPQQNSKLEKADILEATVNYVRRLQTQHGGVQTAIAKEECRLMFRNGYDCAWKVTGQMAQEHLQTVLPPRSGPHVTQIHLGFIEQLKKLQHPPPFPFPGFMIHPDQLVSSIPTGHSTTKSSPASPESAYGSSPDVTPSSSAKQMPVSIPGIYPTTPLARPVKATQKEIDVELSNDEGDSDFDEDAPSPPAAKKPKLASQKEEQKVWRPF